MAGTSMHYSASCRASTRSEMFGADVVWLGARLCNAAKIVVPPHFHEHRLDFHCAPPPVKLVAVQH